jgi:hypothetical protein
MEDFDLRKYLADNRLLKEATIKVGDKVDVKPGVIDDFPSDQYVYNVNVEKINGDKLTVKDANDDEYEVSISDVEELNENKLLKERIDPNSEIADYVKGMFDSSVYDYEGIQSDVWSKAEYAATSPGEGSVFMDLVDYLKSVGGKDVLEGNPDIYLELLPNEDIQWKAEIILNPQDDLRYQEIDTFLNDNFDEVKAKIGNIPSKFKIMGDSKVATAADGERGIDISFDKEHMLSLFPEEDPFNEVESIEIAGQTVYYNDYL